MTRLLIEMPPAPHAHSKHPGDLIERIVAAYMSAQCGWQGATGYHGHSECWRNGEAAGRGILLSSKGEE